MVQTGRVRLVGAAVNLDLACQRAEAPDRSVALTRKRDIQRACLAKLIMRFVAVDISNIGESPETEEDVTEKEGEGGEGVAWNRRACALFAEE